MEWNLIFFVNSVLLGVGLAMDAFSVSIANALSESSMKKSRMCFIAGVYAFFQFSMPMIGWICVHTIVEYFSKSPKTLFATQGPRRWSARQEREWTVCG